MVSANTEHFKVFHNTLDPAVFGTVGGAHLVNITGNGDVEAVTICIRFQGFTYLKTFIQNKLFECKF